MPHFLMIGGFGAVVLAGWTLHKSLYAPSTILGIVWLLLATGHFFLADDFYVNMPVAVLSVLHLAAFLLGDFTGSLIVHFARGTRRSPDRQGQGDVRQSRLKLVILGLGLISLIGTAAYFWIFLAHFGSLNGLLSAGWQVREDIGAGLINVPLPIRMAMLCGYSVHLLALYYWLRFGLTWMLAIGPACILLSGITQSGRAGTLIIVLMWISAYLWRGMIVRRIGLPRLLRGAAAGVVLCGSIFVIGMLYRSQAQRDVITSDDVYREAKIYALGGLSGLASFLDDPPKNHVPGHGAYSFASLAQLLGVQSFVFGIYEEYYPVSKVGSELQSSTNVYTWLRPATDDFGYLGALTYFFAMGALVAAIYRLARLGRDWAVPVTLCFMTILMFSVFAALTQHTSILAALFLPAILVRLCTREVTAVSAARSPGGGK